MKLTHVFSHSCSGGLAAAALLGCRSTVTLGQLLHVSPIFLGPVTTLRPVIPMEKTEARKDKPRHTSTLQASARASPTAKEGLAVSSTVKGTAATVKADGLAEHQWGKEAEAEHLLNNHLIYHEAQMLHRKATMRNSFYLIPFTGKRGGRMSDKAYLRIL